MLTPQDISDKEFVKAVFGGYDMTGVDEFLETVSADYTALYKENAILKGKLKVLVEKVEEYRSTEDAMRMALLTAQRMGDEIMSDANKEKDKRLSDADVEAKARIDEASRRVADEEMRLNIAAKETAKFIELSQAIMKKHSEFLTKLETARRAVQPVTAPSQTQAARQDNQVQQQANTKSVQPRGAKQESEQNYQTSRDDEIAQTADQIGAAIKKMTEPNGKMSSPSAKRISNDDYRELSSEDSIDDDDSLTPRPKFDFDNLQFGENFAGDK